MKKEGEGGGGPSGDVADQAFCLKSAPVGDRSTEMLILTDVTDLSARHVGPIYTVAHE